MFTVQPMCLQIGETTANDPPLNASTYSNWLEPSGRSFRNPPGRFSSGWSLRVNRTLPFAGVTVVTTIDAQPPTHPAAAKPTKSRRFTIRHRDRTNSTSAS